MSKKKTARPRFEYWRGWDGDWYFHGIARNGKIVFPSEGYTRKENCLKGIAAAKTIAASDVIIQVEEDGIW